jgi:3-oxoacyl-[acyl-carrier protein] reductase
MAAEACRHTLASEGASLVDADDLERADIVVAFGTRQPGSDLLSATVDDLYATWDSVVDAITAYRRALPHMQQQHWGRLVWVGTASSRSLDADHDDRDLVATLGMRALHKVIAFDEGPSNVLANTVLRDADASDDEIAAAVAFFCSEGAGYLTGVTLTIDGGAGSAVF